MNTIAHPDTVVVGGVDTHKDIHVAAIFDGLGRLIATASFPTTRHGYRALLQWLQSHGELGTVGVEGCGSWGAGLARYLTARGVDVLEGEPTEPARAAAPRQVRHPRRRSRRPRRALRSGERNTRSR